VYPANRNNKKNTTGRHNLITTVITNKAGRQMCDCPGVGCEVMEATLVRRFGGWLVCRKMQTGCETAALNKKFNLCVAVFFIT
jgi:hypothetical protein